MDPVERAAAQCITQLKLKKAHIVAPNHNSLKCLSDGSGRDQAVDENNSPPLEPQFTTPAVARVHSPVFLVLF